MKPSKSQYGAIGPWSAGRLRHIRSEYNLDISFLHDLKADYERDEGMCNVCRQKPATDLDHCHQLSVYRGILCRSCNTNFVPMVETSLAHPVLTPWDLTASFPAEKVVSAVNYVKRGQPTWHPPRFVTLSQVAKDSGCSKEYVEKIVAVHPELKEGRQVLRPRLFFYPAKTAGRLRMITTFFKGFGQSIPGAGHRLVRNYLVTGDYGPRKHNKEAA